MNDERPAPNRRVIRRHSAEDREKLIHDFRTSGSTARAFCEQHGIHPTTLSGWIRKTKEAAAGFTQMQVPMAAAAPIEVDLPNGVRIRVRTTGDVSRTAELIRAVAAPIQGQRGC